MYNYLLNKLLENYGYVDLAMNEECLMYTNSIIIEIIVGKDPS